MPPQYRCGPNILDLERGFAIRGREEVRLTTKERSLLVYLAERAGQTVPRDEVLVKVWGYPRPVRTRAVDNVVRRIRQKIEEDPSEPRYLFTVYGEGYRLVAEPVVEGAPARPLDDSVPGTAAAPETPEAPVPEQPEGLFAWRLMTTFIGREWALRAISETWERARVVQILGPGGVGKTRLAREHGRARVERGETAVFCDLSEAHDAFAVRRAISRSLGGWLDAPDPGDQAEALERAARAAGDALLVLDNAEQVVATVGQIVERLIVATEELKILVTSRRRLPGARVVPVTLGPLPPESCLQLLRDRVGYLPDWRDEDLVALAEVLDGQPLAMELAASRCGVLGPGELIRRAGESLVILRASSGPARHRALDACVQVSWELLEEEEQRALARLSLFPAGFDPGLAEEMLEGEETEPLDLLQALVDASLVTHAPAGRLHLPHAVRLFALPHVEDRDVAMVDFGRVLADFCATQVARNRDRQALDALGGEHDNLVFAVEAVEDPDQRAWITLGLEAWLSTRGALNTRLELLEAACQAPPSDPTLHARVIIALTRTLSLEHHPDRMEALAEQALELLPPEAHEVRATALQAIGWAKAARGERDAAKATFLSARELAPVHVRRDVDADLHDLGLMDEVTAEAVMQELLRLPPCGPLVRFCTMRGVALRHQGKVLEAEAANRRGLAAAEELGWSLHVCGLHANLGDLLIGMGHDNSAREHLQAAIQGATPLGVGSLLATANATLGGLELLSSDAAAALAHMDQALELVRSASAVWKVPMHAFRAAARAELGMTELAREDLDRSRRILDAADGVGVDSARKVVRLSEQILAVALGAPVDRAVLRMPIGDDGDLRILLACLQRLVG